MNNFAWFKQQHALLTSVLSYTPPTTRHFNDEMVIEPSHVKLILQLFMNYTIELTLNYKFKFYDQMTHFTLGFFFNGKCTVEEIYYLYVN